MSGCFFLKHGVRVVTVMVGPAQIAPKDILFSFICPMAPTCISSKTWFIGLILVYPQYYLDWLSHFFARLIRVTNTHTDHAIDMHCVGIALIYHCCSVGDVCQNVSDCFLSYDFLLLLYFS